MKPTSVIVLAAALVGGASCKRVLQDIPVVGLGPVRPPTSSTSQAESSTSGTDEEELREALEADDQVTGKINLYGSKKYIYGRSICRTDSSSSR